MRYTEGSDDFLHTDDSIVSPLLFTVTLAIILSLPSSRHIPLEKYEYASMNISLHTGSEQVNAVCEKKKIPSTNDQDREDRELRSLHPCTSNPEPSLSSPKTVKKKSCLPECTLHLGGPAQKNCKKDSDESGTRTHAQFPVPGIAC